MAAYTEAQLERIETLKQGADTSPYAAGVVDLLGRTYQDDMGRFRTVKEGHCRRRFEVRSLQHIRVYGFTVIHYNAKAAELIAAEGEK